MEQLPKTPGKRHVGRFSEGIEGLPDEVRTLHVRSFGDRFDRAHKPAA